MKLPFIFNNVQLLLRVFLGKTYFAFIAWITSWSKERLCNIFYAVKRIRILIFWNKYLTKGVSRGLLPEPRRWKKKTENCLFPFHHEIYHNSTKHKLFYHVEKVEPKHKDYALLRVSKQVSRLPTNLSWSENCSIWMLMFDLTKVSIWSSLLFPSRFTFWISLTVQVLVKIRFLMFTD